MPTTIEQLELEVQSSSTSAVDIVAEIRLDNG